MIQRPSWLVRRRLIYATLLFCAGIISYLTGFGTDTRLAETIAYGAWGTGVMVLGSYVFGATWDDKNVMTLLGRKASEQPADPAPAQTVELTEADLKE